MKNLYLTIFCSFCSLFLLGQSNPNLVDKIDDYLVQKQQSVGLNGVVLIAKKGKVLYKKAFGMVDAFTKRPLQADAPFYLGSIAKQFTTMGIMMLKEQGKLTYEDPLSKFFPQFPAYAKDITIRHLMNHTSGIKDHYNLGIYKKGLTNQDVFDLLLTKDLDFNPSDKWQYSNGGYVLLAMIIEKVSGQPLYKFMDKQIFKRLDMECTYVVHPKTKHPKHRAKGFSPKGEVADKAMGNDYEIFTTGAGGIYSNVDDLLKWDQALYSDKLITKQTMLEAYEPTQLNDGSFKDYGFGWAIVKKDKVVGHTGSLNGFRNFIERDMENNIFIMALTNNTATYRDDLRNGLRKIINENRTIALKNANIIDVKTGQIKENQTIIIENGRIKSINNGQSPLSSQEDKVIDATGKYIMPGMVDAHIHFFQSGGLYTRPDAIDLRKYRPYETEINWLKAEAGSILKRYLQAGITTVVDVGGPMHNYNIRETFQKIN